MKFKVLTLLILSSSLLWSQGKKKGKEKKEKKDEWSISEYSGVRDARTVRMALSSKAFSWLTGSPADNEKLSVGKTAQFFGFVALRYGSGRSAKRGSLGRAFEALATEQQKAILLTAVKAEDQAMKEWWTCRSKILRLLESHLYTGEAHKLKELDTLAREFGLLAAKFTLIEAKAFATVEDSLTKEQLEKLRQYRNNPDLAGNITKNKGKKGKGISREHAAQYEDLFAKCFSWITGTMKDNQVLPLGQPAQFFGFVSIRHKSGHGASRGKISKNFSSILSRDQGIILDNAVKEIKPWVDQFISKRNDFLLELGKLRTKPESFSPVNYKNLAEQLGLIEIKCGVIEASCYHLIRKSMTEEQSDKMMDLRSNYIIDDAQMEKLSSAQRGEKLYNLCAACHSKTAKIAPELTGIFSKNAASAIGYEYSAAMIKHGGIIKQWNEENMNTFLAAPMKTVPGTKMGFQGLLNQDDRQALIQYLKSLK
jgi:cytochrome c